MRSEYRPWVALLGSALGTVGCWLACGWIRVAHWYDRRCFPVSKGGVQPIATDTRPSPPSGGSGVPKSNTTKTCGCCNGHQETAPGVLCSCCGGRGYVLSSTNV